MVRSAGGMAATTPASLLSATGASAENRLVYQRGPTQQRGGVPGPPLCFSNTCSSNLPGMQAWEAHDPTLARPIAAPLKLCAELLGVDLDAIQEAADHVEPYLRVDGTKIWSLMQLERQLRPDAYGRVRGGYIARRRQRATGTHTR
jgi:hypothetical protein